MKESDLAYWTRRAEEEDRRARVAVDPAVRAYHRNCRDLYRQRIGQHSNAGIAIAPVAQIRPGRPQGDRG